MEEEYIVQKNVFCRSQYVLNWLTLFIYYHIVQKAGLIIRSLKEASRVVELEVKY